MTEAVAWMYRFGANDPVILPSKRDWADNNPKWTETPLYPAEALTERASMAAEIERLRVANGILEDGLQEVGDDYPGSSCQKWCQHQINMARAALEARK